MLRPLAAAMVLGSCSQVWALSVPTPSAKDAHVRTEIYDPMNRVPIVLQKGMVTNIAFSPSERIKRTMFGLGGPVSSLDPQDANQAPMVNNVQFFGREVGVSNAVVVTILPDGMERTYVLALRVVPTPADGSEDPAATFSLMFTYPLQEKAAAQQVAAVSWKEQKAAKDKAVAEARLNQDVFYGVQNWKYLAQGKDSDIAPTEAHDNGRITGFRYPGNMPHPTVFVVTDTTPGMSQACTTGKPSGDEGQESAPQTRAYDDMLIVEQTAPHFRLRSGTKVVEIYNCGWDPIGSNPGTGTTSPDVIRKVISSSK
jgi:type IV secretion system protein VirB9